MLVVTPSTCEEQFNLELYIVAMYKHLVNLKSFYVDYIGSYLLSYNVVITDIVVIATLFSLYIVGKDRYFERKGEGIT